MLFETDFSFIQDFAPFCFSETHEIFGDVEKLITVEYVKQMWVITEHVNIVS